MTLTDARPSVSEIRFGAMGSDVHVIVVGGHPDLAPAARARIDQLEARWSRFRPDSELSRLNRLPGRPVIVSSDTLTGVIAAVDAWKATDGRFDPTVLPALVAAGYDRTFAQLSADDPSPYDSPGAAPGCAGIDIDAAVRSVTLPPGTEIDLGGIGKGLAADLVADELLEAGAAGACVNIGGDLRVRGAAPTADGWIVDVEHLPDLRIALADGAVATSSCSKRRWKRAGMPLHHLLDPRRGRPAAAGLTSVTIVAGSAAIAERLTKAVFVAGADGAAEIIEDAHATGLLVGDSGNVIRLAGIEEYLR